MCECEFVEFVIKMTDRFHDDGASLSRHSRPPSATRSSTAAAAAAASVNLQPPLWAPSATNVHCCLLLPSHAEATTDVNGPRERQLLSIGVWIAMAVPAPATVALLTSAQAPLHRQGSFLHAAAVLGSALHPNFAFTIAAGPVEHDWISAHVSACFPAGVIPSCVKALGRRVDGKWGHAVRERPQLRRLAGDARRQTELRPRPVRLRPGERRCRRCDDMGAGTRSAVRQRGQQQQRHAAASADTPRDCTRFLDGGSRCDPEITRAPAHRTAEISSGGPSVLCRHSPWR